MVDKEEPRRTELVRCAVCEKEIPESGALSVEDQDYVLHFCSPHCQDEWSADQMAVKEQEAGDP